MKDNRVPFQNVHYSWGIRRAARAAPLFHSARSKLSQNVHYSMGKKGSHPRGDCERPARTSFLERRGEERGREGKGREGKGEERRGEERRGEERSGEERREVPSNVPVELMAVTQCDPQARLARWWKLPGAEHKATRLKGQEKRCERSEFKEEVQCAWTFTWGQDAFCCGKGLREHSLREEARRVKEQNPPRVTTRSEDQCSLAKQRNEYTVEATWGEGTDVMLDVREIMSTRKSRTSAVHGD